MLTFEPLIFKFEFSNKIRVPNKKGGHLFFASFLAAS